MHGNGEFVSFLSALGLKYKNAIVAVYMCKQMQLI